MLFFFDLNNKTKQTYSDVGADASLFCFQLAQTGAQESKHNKHNSYMCVGLPALLWPRTLQVGAPSGGHTVPAVLLPERPAAVEAPGSVPDGRRF